MHTIELPPHCDRAAAAALYPELVEAVSGTPTPIDASKVERLGQAMMQLLVSAAATGGGIALQNPSAQFRDARQMAGLDAVLLDGDGA